MKKLMMTTAAMVLLGAGAAKADFWHYGTTGPFAPAEFTVTGDANGYNKVNGHDKVTFDTVLEYWTGHSGRIKSWRMEPRIKIASEEVNPFWLQEFGKGNSYPAFNRPKSIKFGTTMYVPMSTLKYSILGFCNDILEGRLDSGMSPVQAYGKEAIVPMQVKLHVEVDANGPGTDNPQWSAEYPGPNKGWGTGPLVRCMPIAITPDMPGTVKVPTPAKPGFASDKAPKPGRAPAAGRAPQPGTAPGTAPGRAPATKATLVPVRPVPQRPQSSARP